MSLASGTYAADARVQQLADALSQDPSLVGKVWNKQLRKGAQSVDDFAPFEGPERSEAPFVVRNDLQGTNAGDEVVFTVMSQPRGPGARGEGQLTGNTAVVNWATYGCKVDYWRDAFEWTKKQAKFMAAGGSMKSAVMNAIKAKLGRKRMNDMKMALKLLGSGNTIYPNGKKTRASLTGLDTMTTTLLTTAKPQWQRLGGMPFKIGYNKRRSPVYSCMAYIPNDAMTGIRLSPAYENALLHAAGGNDNNPLFDGRLLDWQGIGLFEHIQVDAEYDVIGDPLAPRATISVGFGVDMALGAGEHDDGVLQLISDASDLKTRFFEFFDGYAYEFWEGQAAHASWSSFYTAIGAASYYAWVLNTDGSVGFIEYLGSGNNGNRITVTKILNPDNTNDASTLGDDTVGNFVATGDTWGLNTAGSAYARSPGGTGASSNCSPDFNWSSEFDAGATIIPCNANGAVDFCSLFMGQSTAVRAYVGDDQLITQERDFGFVQGGGYETIFGQTPCIRTDRKTHGYALLRHAGQHIGLEVPSLNE